MRRGKPNPKTAPQRFAAKVQVDENGCWLWTAEICNGYGRFYPDGTTFPAHRWSYQHFVGPIPEGYEVDHLCRNPRCVNPEHLEAVTPQVNTLRSDSVSAVHARKTHCPKGHPYDGVTVRPSNIRGSRIQRRCKTCHREQERARRHAIRPPGTPRTVHRGEGHPGAKLTAVQVAEIRRLRATEGISCRRLGEQFGVSRSAIRFIVSGKTWREE